MRGIYTNVNDIRKKVYAEVARLSYEYKDGDLSQMHQIPYNVVPGVVSTYRESTFLERAIVRERIRLAMGLNLRSFDEYNSVTYGAEECVKPEKYYQPPLINIIKFACNKCPENVMRVTDSCQGCLAHPCMEVCPKDAITMVKGKSHINSDKCIKCGKCKDACPYGAIMKLERPCARVCGMKAIRSETPVYAAIAPAVTGQFGPGMTPEKIRSAFQALGFEDVIEVAIGADLCTIEEANDFIREVPREIPFMATSCCPAWSMMAKKMFPKEAKCISMALTPMVLTGRLIKKVHPRSKVAFIGPCSAKKLEASRKSIRSDIDFVLTFEEVMGMFQAKNVDFDQLPETD